MDLEMTEEEAREYIRCARSPVYFVEAFCWLQQKASAGVATKSSIIPFFMGSDPEEEFFFQREILEWLWARENVLVKKSRRVGCSWIAAAFAVWLINFNENITVNLISQTGTKAKEILGKCRFILNNLKYHDHDSIRRATPASFLRGELDPSNNNKQQLSLVWRNDDGSVSTRSEIVSLNQSDNAGRGDDPTFIVYDELAFYEHPDEVWASSQPGLTRGGFWMGISTPKGIGHVYHRMTSRAELHDQGKLNENLEFKFRKINFWEAGITEEQIAKSTVGMPQDYIDQEWHLKEIVPGSAVFDPTCLAACFKPLSEFPEIAQELELYRKKVLAMNNIDDFYCNGVDTAAVIRRGNRDPDWNSWSSMTRSNIQAFAYHSKETLSSWAGSADANKGIPVGKVSKLHAEWPGFTQIELEGPGYTTWTNHITPDDLVSQTHGVHMKQKFKKGIIERLVVKVEQLQIIITDPYTYQCMMTYQKGSQPGQYQASVGYFDDPVISLALASDGVDKNGGMDYSLGDDVNEAERLPSGRSLLGEEPLELPLADLDLGLDELMDELGLLLGDPLDIPLLGEPYV